MDFVDRIEERKRRQAQEERLRRLEQDGDIRAVLATREGRRFVWRLIDELAGAFSRSHSGEQTHETAYFEGKRAVGLELMQEAQRIDDSAYVQMMSEELATRRETAARLKAAEQEDAET